jgi:diguanylate cyclase (GGDEF)-like protein
MIHSLLSPAVRLMQQLRYAYKFAAIGLLAAIAIIYLFIVFASNLQSAIDAAHKEHDGLSVEIPLIQLIRLTQQHRRLSVNFIGGVESLKADRKAKQFEINQAILTVQSVIESHGKSLNLSSDWATVKSHWLAMSSDEYRQSVDNTLNGHTELIKLLLSMESKIGEDSLLVLDPAARSYHLMAAGIDKYPAAIESAFQLDAQVGAVLAKKTINDTDKVELLKKEAVMLVRYEELEKALRLAAKSNPEIASELNEPLNAFHQIVFSISEVVHKDILASKMTTTLEQYAIKVSVFEKDHDQKNGVLLTVLNQILLERIAILEQQYYRSAAVAGPAFLILFIYLSAGAYMAIMAAVHALRNGTERIAAGDFTTPVSLSCKDELLEIATSVNAMREQLHWREKEAQQHTEQLQELNQKLELLSMTDGLTGIANRRCFDTVLAREWSRASRLGQPLTLALIDVDWFKKYNDHYGHQAGDECLKRVAQAMAKTVCRSGDLLARYGGEEFVFIALNCSIDNGNRIAQNVCHAIAALSLPHEKSALGSVTVSIGVVSMTPKVGGDVQLMLKAADEALYSAKENGRNRVGIGTVEG